MIGQYRLFTCATRVKRWQTFVSYYKQQQQNTNKNISYWDELTLSRRNKCAIIKHILMKKKIITKKNWNGNYVSTKEVENLHLKSVSQLICFPWNQKHEMYKKSTIPLVNFLRDKTLTFIAFSTQRSTQQQKVAKFLKSVAAWGKVCIKFKLLLNFQIFTTLVNVFETLALTTFLLSAYSFLEFLSFFLVLFIWSIYM